MYHTHMHESLSSVTPAVTISNVTYVYGRLTRRDDSDSSPSSASSTKNSKSAECTGSKQKCQEPTNSNHSTSVTVGVAVAVPIGVIIIVLAVILYIVYRRSKKEAEEDNDPDFEGDSEYLPAMRDYSSGMNHPYSSDSQQDFVEKPFQPPPSDPFTNSMHSSEYNLRSVTPPAISRSWYVDPFQLPHESNDCSSLRDFAIKVQGDGIGGYKVAANSRNASQTSLHPDNFSNHTPLRASSRFQDSGSIQSYNNLTDNNQISHSSVTAVAYKQSPSPNELTESARIDEETEIPNDSHRSPSNDAFEFEFDDTSEKTHRKSLQASNYDDYELQVIKEPENADDGTGSKSEDDDYYVSRLSPNEEEDIQRMKSIYQVYLDRAKTMINGQDNSKGQLNDETRMDNIDHNPPSSIQISNHDSIKNIEFPNAKHQAQEALATEDTSSEVYASKVVQNQNQYSIQDTLAVNDTEAVASNRIASSIYSEAIQPLNYQGKDQKQEQVAVYGGYPQSLAAEYNGNVQQQGYAVPAFQNPQWYGAPTPQQHQYDHPQTLETIGELPTPAYLGQSVSSHSLTSFKRPNKQQLLQLQTARLNGTALNPVDHPAMFYSPTNDAYYAPQRQGQFMKSNENGAVPSPYQLRQSVVMTNPSDLTAKPSYKPAGSFRSVSATNSRNNSLTTQNNTYLQQQQQQQQQQQYNLRVSGILEETDIVQPPSVGGILPHSGSQDDLRRQLGSSHNYAVN